MELVRQWLAREHPELTVLDVSKHLTPAKVDTYVTFASSHPACILLAQRRRGSLAMFLALSPDAHVLVLHGSNHAHFRASVSEREAGGTLRRLIAGDLLCDSCHTHTAEAQFATCSSCAAMFCAECFLSRGLTWCKTVPSAGSEHHFECPECKGLTSFVIVQ